MINLITYVKTMFQSRFVRNVLTVATGTAGAQAITMAFSPVITRLYGPEAFGLLGTFMAITAVLTPAAAMTYPGAIVLSRSDEEAKGIVKLSILLAAVLSMIGFLIIMIWGNKFAQFLKIESISSYLWLIPFAILFAGVHQVLEQLLIRSGAFKVTARVAVIQSIGLNFAKSGVGFLYPQASILVIFHTISNGLHALLLWWSSQRTKNILNTNTNIKYLAYKYRSFPLFRAPEVIVNAVSQGLPILLLAAFFGSESAGFYTLSRSVLSLPALLIGKSVVDVLYPHLSNMANSQHAIYPSLKKITLMIAIFGIIPFSFIFLLGPFLFGVVFGSDWSKAGEYGSILSISLFFNFVINPAVRIAPVIDAQKFVFIFTFISAIFKFPFFYFSYIFFKSDIYALASLIAIDSMAYLILILVLFAKFKAFDKNILNK